MGYLFSFSFAMTLNIVLKSLAPIGSELFLGLFYGISELINLQKSLFGLLFSYFLAYSSLFNPSSFLNIRFPSSISFFLAIFAISALFAL